MVNTDKLTYVANLDSLPGAEGNPHYSFEKQYICEGAGPRKLYERYQPDAVMTLTAKTHADRSTDGPGELMDHRYYPFIANSHPVTRSVLIQPETSDRVVECNGLRVFH
ncbi:hypothetical protein GCM10007857_32880 [Bradyrhizobium iriomotense]|uniref:Uncharacterized protein n=1 Tax=Bradyrhizobium iriomotense TaxID=441950 RepID=A0ABQ6AWJ7_9BRAD|nr:hypothetical protein GCM10007857_32880 [Bradyrhizobium iriomotense]